MNSAIKMSRTLLGCPLLDLAKYGRPDMKLQDLKTGGWGNTDESRCRKFKENHSIEGCHLVLRCKQER
jgi:hypothetical protein